MKTRSLRWRLVVSMILIIATVVAAAGLFSTVLVRRELHEFIVQERRASTGMALRGIRSTSAESLRRAYEQTRSPILVADDAKNVVAWYPPDMESYRVRFLAAGTLELTRTIGGRAEVLVLRSAGNHVPGVGTVYFLPPRLPRQRGELRGSIDRWLAAGLAGAALLAMVVMVTIFRRVLAPVEALTAGARALAGGRLDARVPVRGDDEVAELGRAFNSMAEGLERNERARRNMVSDVAHELRTPLTNIRVQIEAVQDGVIAADDRFLASVAEETTTLARLVDDLQQLSLAEAGQLRLELAEVTVAELVGRAAPGGIVRDIPPELIVRADARRMVQVIRNLIVNAVAHAQSSVVVSASRAGSSIEIRVSDDGPGVPEEHAERIFDRFYRVDGSRSRTTGGAGLGLAIARQLVELHGGRIWYERPAFVIALPA